MRSQLTVEEFRAWIQAEGVEASERFQALRAAGASALQCYTPRVRANDLEACLVYLDEFVRVTDQGVSGS